MAKKPKAQSTQKLKIKKPRFGFCPLCYWSYSVAKAYQDEMERLKQVNTQLIASLEALRFPPPNLPKL